MNLVQGHADNAEAHASCCTNGLAVLNLRTASQSTGAVPNSAVLHESIEAFRRRSTEEISTVELCSPS